MVAYSPGHQMALGSWQAKNWDPEVGSDDFDEFCRRINHPLKSVKDAMAAAGMDANDAIALASAPGFDRTLLNYAAFVRTVSRIEAESLPVSPSTENTPSVPEG